MRISYRALCRAALTYSESMLHGNAVRGGTPGASRHLWEAGPGWRRCVLIALSQPLTTAWRMYDNSRAGQLRLIAGGSGVRRTRVVDSTTWRRIKEGR